MAPKGMKPLKWPKLETIKVEKEVGNPNNMALTFDTRNAGGDLADALFIDGNEDMGDYTMKIRASSKKLINLLPLALLFVLQHHKPTSVLKRPINGIVVVKNHLITLLMSLNGGRMANCSRC